MRSTTKTVLFNKTTEGKMSHMRPVAVFANNKSALVHKGRLLEALKAGDVEKYKTLDPGVHLTADGKLHDDSKFAILEVPYEPEITAADADEASFTI